MVWSRSTSWSVAMSRTEPNDLVERGRRVLALEAEAIRRVAERLGPAFAAAVHLLAGAPGRLIVSGVGKSGLIARKIAATLTSTGTPASFLHPVDSLHGDLGIVGRRDVAILLSKSGASDELFGLVSQLKRLGVPMIAITGDPESILGRQAEDRLWIPRDRDHGHAQPLELAHEPEQLIGGAALRQQDRH